MRNFSLKTKMSLAVSGLFILFSVSLAWQFLSYFDGELKKSISSQQYSLATSLANGIDDKLAIAHQALIATAGTIPFSALADVDRGQRLLDGSTALHSIFDNGLFLFSPQGRLIVESPFLSRARQGRDFSFREYFRTTVATGKPQISSPYLSTRRPGHPAIMLTAPIFDQAGRLVAILGGSFDLQGSNIIRELDAVKIGETGYVYLADRARTLLVHPDRERIMEQVKPGLNSMLDRAVDGFEGSGETVNSRGMRQLASFKRLRTTDWILGVAYPTAEAYAPLAQARRNFIIGTLVGTSAALLLVWLLMTRLTAQLTSITQQVAAFPENRGEEKRIEIDSGDEIGALAHTFNAMLDTLKRKRQAQEESEAKLNDERLLLKTLLQTLPDPVWLKDGNGVYLICNAAFGRLYDDTPSAIVGRTDNDYVDAELAAFFQQKDREAIAAGQPRTNEEWVTYASDGHQALWETTKTPVFDAQGRVVGALGVARDITERKRLEDELRSREEYQRALLDNFPFMVWLKDTESRFLAVNRQFLLVAGLTDDASCLGKTDLDFFPIELAEGFRADDREVMHSGQKKTVEELVGLRGMLLWHETYKAPVYDADGKLLGTVGFARDITERKQAEQRLRDARSRLAAVFATIPDLVWLKDQNGVYLACNPAFEKFFGAPEAEIVGKTDHDFVPAELADFFIRKDRDAMAAGRVCINEEEITYADDGRQGFLETRKVPVYDADGMVSGVLGVARDITERKQAEETLKNSERRLADIINLLPDATFAIDLEGKITIWNRAAEEFTGAKAEQMLGRGNYEHAIPFYGERRPILIDLVLNPSAEIERRYPFAQNEDGVISGEAYTLSVKRGEAYMLGLAAPLYDSEGKMIGAIESVRDITDRKKTEELLRRHEYEFRTLTENLPDNILRYDRQCRKIYGNSRMLGLLGVEAHQLLDKTTEELHPEGQGGRDAYYHKLRRVLASGEPDEIEFSVSPPGGGIQIHNVRFVAERDGGGEIVGVLAIGRDITERKRTEAAHQESEERFRSIFEAAAASMVLIAPDGRFLQTNRATRTFLGYTEEEMRQRTVEDVTHPEDRERTRSSHQRLTDGEDSVHYEKRYLRKDGETVWGHVSIAVVNDPEGRPLYSVGMVQDLTGYKHFEAELLASERQYHDLSEEFQTLLDGIPDRIIHLSPQLTVIWANKAATKYVGHDIKGLPCNALFHDRATPCNRCPIIRAFASGENEEELMIDREGRHWGVKAFPLKDRSGKVVSVIDYATDITEKIHLRDAAAQARHLAALGELSAGVAHEINNPNGVILLNAAFLKRVFSEVAPLLAVAARRHHPLLVAGMEVDEVLREVPLLLSEVHDGARRIQRIVDGLKEFVRTPVADPEPVDLNSVVAAAIRVTATEIEAATAHFTVTYGAGVQSVSGSRQAIEQVIINLLTNACQALPDRERGIRITTRLLAESGKAMIEVRDAGSGILPENLPHITDPFFTTKRQSGGTGLGLSISNSLIKECGGTMQFSSSPGAGTTVTVILPLWKAKDES